MEAERNWPCAWKQVYHLKQKSQTEMSKRMAQKKNERIKSNKKRVRASILLS